MKTESKIAFGTSAVLLAVLNKDIAVILGSGILAWCVYKLHNKWNTEDIDRTLQCIADEMERLGPDDERVKRFKQYQERLGKDRDTAKWISYLYATATFICWPIGISALIVNRWLANKYLNHCLQQLDISIQEIQDSAEAFKESAA